jgi:hypothetical protein
VVSRADAFLLGRSTYDAMHAVWPKVTDPDNRVAAALNGLPKHVVSTTLADPTWQNTTVISTDVIDAVSALRDGPGRELQVHGSWQLARTLHDAGLVDEYRQSNSPRARRPIGRRIKWSSSPGTFSSRKPRSGGDRVLNEIDPAAAERVVRSFPFLACFTLDTYGHLFPSEMEALADRLEMVRDAALAKRARTQRGPTDNRLGEPAGG